MNNKIVKTAITVLFSTYFFIIAIFLASISFLPTWMKNLELRYASDTQMAISEILENTELEEIPAAITKLRQTNPLEISIYYNDEEVYQTIPKLQITELQSILQEEAILLEAQGTVTTAIRQYYVWYSIYHPSIAQSLNNLAIYQIIFILIGFLILMTALYLIFRSTIKPLTTLKTRLSQLEDYDLATIQNDEEVNNDNLNQSVQRFAENLQGKFHSISRNYTELEYALQMEKERLTNLVTISRGLVHNLKSPIHQTIIENDIFLYDHPDLNIEARAITELNIDRQEKLMLEVNDIINLLKTDVNEMISVRDTFDIIKLFREICRTLNTYRAQKNLSLYSDIPEELNITFNRATIHLIIHNLISNALKYAKINSEISFEIYEANSELILSCTNEASKQDLERMRKSEELVYAMETSTNDSEADEYAFSSGAGMFLIRELSEISHGRYEVEQTDAAITITISLSLK